MRDGSTYWAPDAARRHDFVPLTDAEWVRALPAPIEVEYCRRCYCLRARCEVTGDTFSGVPLFLGVGVPRGVIIEMLREPVMFWVNTDVKRSLAARRLN